METVDTLWLLIAVWFLGMFLTFLLEVHATRIWRIALHGHADGVLLRKSSRLTILYSQYWLVTLAMSVVWLVFAAMSMVIAEHTTAPSLKLLAQLVAYIMGVLAIGTMVFSTVGVRYLRRVILSDRVENSARLSDRQTS
ncbi:MAG: hypothetical protein AAF436_14935 [Myxococcota bacterium]